MQRSDFTSANRVAWDQAEPYHARHTFENNLQSFRQPDFNGLGELRIGLLRKLGIDGRAVAHIACNNGRELISIARLGAGRCVGFDFSERFIGQARRLAESAQSPCEFVVCDAYDIAAAYAGIFDIAFVSPGTLRWMPDLPGFIGAAGRLLRPGGFLLVLEMHPILDMFSAPHLANGQVQISRPYFSRGPYKVEDGLDYYGNVRYDSAPAYWFHHPTSEILAACNAGSLVLREFSELPHDLSGGAYRMLAGPGIGMPMSISLIAERV